MLRSMRSTRSMRRNAISEARGTPRINRSGTDQITDSERTAIWKPQIPNLPNQTPALDSPASNISSLISAQAHLPSTSHPSSPSTLVTSITTPSTSTKYKLTYLLLQSAPTSQQDANASTPNPAPSTMSTSNVTTNTEAATKLAEALDDFLGDVERKFKGISDEILARLDEMAERCDRLEGELLRKETGASTEGGKA